jgi:hypothetical protein
MAKSDCNRWRDWRVNRASGQSIRADDLPTPKRGRRGAGKGWWWTLAARQARCAVCRTHIGLDQKIAYHHQTQVVLCPACADAERVAEKCELSRRVLKVGS